MKNILNNLPKKQKEGIAIHGGVAHLMELI